MKNLGLATAQDLASVGFSVTPRDLLPALALTVVTERFAQLEGALRGAAAGYASFARAARRPSRGMRKHVRRVKAGRGRAGR